MTSLDDLVTFTGPQLLQASEGMSERGEAHFRNGVTVNTAQLRKAAAILMDGPQPVANGIKADMPGFIHREQQTGRSLVLQVGILPSHTYRIDRLGRAREVPRG